METDPKPSTSYIQSDSSDDDDNHHENLSTEEICHKIKTFRNLCFGNKINVSNAFDIDMIGYFYSWLEKKKSSIFEDDNDITSFQEISDYLEATAKVYSYRVDNLTETTSKLVEQFKTMNYNKNTTKIDDNNAPKLQKVKRQKMMLTTSDKLRRKPNENESFINSSLINHQISGFNCDELFATKRPFDHLNSMYFNKSLTEEMKATNDKIKECNEKKNNETIEVDESFLNLMGEISKGAICPEFKGFVAERDKVDNSNDDQLNGIEYRFDPTDYQNNCDESICNEPDNNELASNSNAKNTTVLDGLLECIDNVDRDYSFFNPKLLANWKGPKAWKAQAMMKALKSCTSTERKDIISNTDNNIDEITQENIKQPKTCKKRNKSKNDKIKIDWLDMSQINEVLKKKVQTREKILPRTLQKWDPLDNISDTQSIIVDIKYKFQFLQYAEIKPDWCIQYKNLEENNHSEASNSCENINDGDKGIVETSQAMEIDCENFEQLNNITHEENYDKLATSDVSEELNSNDNIILDIKTESRMDIAELKKEISNIIDEECVETDDSSEWSTKLSFLNLLIKLRITERDGLSIPIVYVGLLHLANERGLKLFQEHCTINDMEETFIAKPMKKN